MLWVLHALLLNKKTCILSAFPFTVHFGSHCNVTNSNYIQQSQTKLAFTFQAVGS